MDIAADDDMNSPAGGDMNSAPDQGHGWHTNEDIKRATESALAFWRSCRRPDLGEEDMVRGALVKYQMSLDAATLSRQKNSASETPASPPPRDSP